MTGDIYMRVVSKETVKVITSKVYLENIPLILQPADTLKSRQNSRPFADIVWLRMSLKFDASSQ